MLAVTPIYAALLTLLYTALTMRVVQYRRQHALSLGDEGDRSLLKRMRAQGNAAETIPIALLLLLIAEVQGAPAIALHLLGLTLLAGRALHAYGFSASPPVLRLRVIGMVLTVVMITLTALGLLLHALF